MNNNDQEYRRVNSPTRLTLGDWWAILKRVFKNSDEYGISMLAAAVAFYSMLATFPALAAVVSLYALIADPVDVTQHISALSGLLPADVVSIFNGQLSAIIASKQHTLGLRFVFGLLLTIWSAHRGVHALVKAITKVYHEQEKRSALHLTLYSLTLTVGVVILVLAAMFVILALTPLLQHFPISGWLSVVVTLISWAILLMMVTFILCILYKLSPPRRSAKWRWLSPGAIFATLLWCLSSVVFSLYVTSWGNYNETYGALGAAVVLLLWFFFTNFSIVLGALLNAEMELQTRSDTTIGADRPMGHRGAVVADTIPPNN